MTSKSVDASGLRCLFTLRTPDNTGGSRVALEYASAIVASGGSVLLVHGPIDKFRVRGEAFLEELRAAGIELLEDSSLNQPFGTRIVSRLVAEVKRRDINMTVGINQRDRPVAIAVASKAAIKSVICGLNQLAFHGPSIVPALKRRLYGHWIRRTDLIVSSSRYVTDEYVKEYDVPAARVVELVHGIELSEISQASSAECEAIRKEFGVDESTTLFTNIGRMERQKGQDILVRAFAQAKCLQDSKLLLVGSLENADSSHVNEVRKLVENSGLTERVIFAGWRNDFILLLSASDVYVHAARFEGLPLVVLTALALGKSSVLPDNASCPPGYIDGEHGFLFQSESAEELATSIDRVFDTTVTQSAALGHAASTLIHSRYDMNIIKKQFVNILLNLQSGKLADIDII